MTIQRILIFILLFITGYLKAQPISEDQKQALIKTIFQHTDDASPGVAIGIIKDGQILYEKYVGYSNLEHQIKIDQQTRFNIASNAKQYTALCILKLAQEGKLQLEDDIRTYLPDLYPDIKDPITISNVITHTSGVRDISALWSIKGITWWQEFVDNDDAMDLIRAQQDLNFKPGTDRIYSNSNYIILTEIVKKVTDQDFSDYAQSVFQELEMPNTKFRTNYMAVIPNKARPYGNWGGWREYPSITETHGDGALFTTLKDQLKWEQIIQQNDGNYCSKAFVQASQSPIAHDYGFGLEFGQYKGLPYTFHDGSTGAYNATFLRFPEEQVAIIVMSNSGSVPTNYLAKQIANIVLEVEDPESVYPGMPETIESLKSNQEILGIYINDGGGIITIVEKEGAIYREIDQQPRKLINEKEGLFYYETNPDLKMNFTHIGTPQQRFTIYLSSQGPATYYKIPQPPLGNFDRAELNGTFSNSETNTQISIKHLENNEYLITRNEKDRKGNLVVKDLLTINAYQLKVIRDSNGKIIGLNANNDRIRNMIFRRL